MKKHFIVVILIFLCHTPKTYSQTGNKIDLNIAIILANDSSLNSFKNKNAYLSSFIENYRFKNKFKPNVNLNASAIDFNRSLTQRYNSSLAIDEYKSRQSISSNFSLSLTENIPYTGGTFSIQSGLNRLQNLGENSNTQYSTIPFSISLSQSLFSFNPYKWDKKIEPLKFEIAKREFIRSYENTSFELITYYFNLLRAQNDVELSEYQLANIDTFYHIALKRYELALITKDELLNFKIEYLNTLNNLEQLKIKLLKSKLDFNLFIHLKDSVELYLEIPNNIPNKVLSFSEVLSRVEDFSGKFMSIEKQTLESKRDLENAKKGLNISPSINLSYGIDQQSSTNSTNINNQYNAILESYQNPLNRQGISIGISIPIIDWGLKHKNYELAKSKYELSTLQSQSDREQIKNEILILVNNYNNQINIVKRSIEMNSLAKESFEITKKRYLSGKSDFTNLKNGFIQFVNTNESYLNSLQLFWEYYYKIREVSLYDFNLKMKL